MSDQMLLFPKQARERKTRVRHFEGPMSRWARMEAHHAPPIVCGADGLVVPTPWNVTCVDCLTLLIVGLMLQRERVEQKTLGKKPVASVRAVPSVRRAA